MKMKTGFLFLALSASFCFAQEEKDFPPMVPLTEVLDILQQMQAAGAAVTISELRRPDCVWTNGAESGGGGPLYVTPMPLQPRTIVVPKNSPDTLQRIVDQANPGDEIVVPPGVYDMGGRQVNQEGTPTRLVIDKPLTLRSEAGPELTVIAGGPSTRCIYMTNGVQVIGFTISGGETMKEGPEGNKFTALSGGGVWSEPGGVLVDCVVASNTALWYGGGLYGGSAVRCTFIGNTARRSGGAASGARLGSCLIAYNRAGRFGGGTLHCELLNCTVTHNRAEQMGGGSAFGTAQNTVLHHNQTLLSDHNFYDVKMSYCCSMPKGYGPGNIDAEPGFKNTDQGAFEPVPGSALIDAGTNTFLEADLTRTARVLDGNNNRHARADIGAYEFVNPLADSDSNGVLDREEPRVKSFVFRGEHPAE